MRVIVLDDEGAEAMNYSTNPNDMALAPGFEERPTVVSALEEATRFLTGPAKLVPPTGAAS